MHLLDLTRPFHLLVLLFLQLKFQSTNRNDPLIFRNDGTKILQFNAESFVEIEDSENPFVQTVNGPIGIFFTMARILLAVGCVVLSLDKLYGFIHVDGFRWNLAQVVLEAECLAGIRNHRCKVTGCSSLSGSDGRLWCCNYCHRIQCSTNDCLCIILLDHQHDVLGHLSMVS